MALELSNFDYDVLDHFLEAILNEHIAPESWRCRRREMPFPKRFPWQRSITAGSPATCRFSLRCGGSGKSHYWRDYGPELGRAKN
jgi:hypothetical protein